MKPAKLKKSLSDIEAFFKTSAGVFKQTELKKLIGTKRDEWQLPTTASPSKLLSQLTEESKLKRTILPSDDYQEIVRYTWDEPSPYTVALSLKEGSYLSHGSAVYLHGLNEQIPKVVYVNKEQSVKPASATPLSQEALTRSFGNKQRESKYIYSYRDHRIVILSGKNTGALEVGEFTGPHNEHWQVTKIHRTLIDIAVRPIYAGGVFQVLEAYKGARDKTSVAMLLATLKRLQYVYPYHQAIGFYMTRAGWKSEHLTKLKELGLKFDFYLDYCIPESQRLYDKEWRLFYPKGL